MRGLRFCAFWVVFIFGVDSTAVGQSRFMVHGELEAWSFISSASVTPFWLWTNQYGIVPNQAPAGLFQAALWKLYRVPDSSHSRKLGWGFGLNPVLTYDRNANLTVVLPEAFGKVRFKAIELYIGRRREVTGFGDTTL